MVKMGVMFEIPNEYGNYLSNLLEPISFDEYQWLLNNTEIHLLENEEFRSEFLFKDDDMKIHGERLYSLAKDNMYYMVFINLMAFFQGGTVKTIRTYREFLDSDCQIIIAVWDCSYVMYWCRTNEMVSKIYAYAMSKGYENIKYIGENDLLEGKYYID